MASALKGDVPFDAGMIALYRNNLEMAVKKFNQYLEEKDFEMLPVAGRWPKPTGSKMSDWTSGNFARFLRY